MTHKKARVSKAYIQSKISSGIAKTLEIHRIAAYKRGYEEGSNDVKGTAAIHYAEKIEELNLALADAKASVKHQSELIKKFESDQRKMCKQIVQSENALQKIEDQKTEIANLHRELHESDDQLKHQEQHYKKKVMKLECEIDELSKKQFVKTEIVQSPSSLTNFYAGMDNDAFLKSLEQKTSTPLLVDNWRDSWKWVSTWCFALIAFFAAVDIPPEVLAVLPDNVRSYVIAFTAFCGLVGRYLNQSGGFKDGSFTVRP